jgi:hypothetical protein
MHTSKDVTEKINNLEELKKAHQREELQKREQALNEELAAAI